MCNTRQDRHVTLFQVNKFKNTPKIKKKTPYMDRQNFIEDSDITFNK